MDQEPVAQTDREKEIRTWAMVLHLSTLAGLVVPVAGLAAPIIIYVIKKESLPELIPHGHVVFNWMISVIIYSIVSVILMFILLGFFTLFAVVILALVFPIIGGIKASEGEVWPYPLSIPIFK